MGTLIYGINSVLESLKGRQRKALELLVDRSSASPRLNAVRDEANRRRVTISPVSRQELDSGDWRRTSSRGRSAGGGYCVH